MTPKLKSLLARIVLVGGIAAVASYMARHAPHDQTVAFRAGSRELIHVEGAVTRLGDDEPTAGFSQAFAPNAGASTSPGVIRHTFSAPNGTYIVVITFQERTAGDLNPIPTETTFERQVSLVGGEVIVSPD
ncbi:MAG TPA: hypothetical protein VHP33_35425 [Polyangiaceae bacterium]|nr:hypothetical protein [Polyangiaceae bacterium]